MEGGERKTDKFLTSILRKGKRKTDKYLTGQTEIEKKKDKRQRWEDEEERKL